MYFCDYAQTKNMRDSDCKSLVKTEIMCEFTKQTRNATQLIKNSFF